MINSPTSISTRLTSADESERREIDQVGPAGALFGRAGRYYRCRVRVCHHANVTRWADLCQRQSATEMLLRPSPFCPPLWHPASRVVTEWTSLSSLWCYSSNSAPSDLLFFSIRHFSSTDSRTAPELLPTTTTILMIKGNSTCNRPLFFRFSSSSSFYLDLVPIFSATISIRMEVFISSLSVNSIDLSSFFCCWNILIPRSHGNMIRVFIDQWMLWTIGG